MTTPPPTNPNVETTPNSGPSFEDSLRSFWSKNKNAIYTFCAIVLLTIVGRETWNAMASHKVEKLGVEYAAANTPEKLRAFAKENNSAELGGLAYLTLADEEYATGKYADAARDYELASSGLKEPLLAGRAKLGLGVSSIAAGQIEKGKSQLKSLADNTSQLKTYRSEATYHLASLAAEAGKDDELKKYVDSLMTLDGAGAWTQRGMMLQARAQAAAAPAATAPAGMQIQVPLAK